MSGALATLPAELKPWFRANCVSNLWLLTRPSVMAARVGPRVGLPGRLGSRRYKPRRHWTEQKAAAPLGSEVRGRRRPAAVYGAKHRQWLQPACGSRRSPCPGTSGHNRRAQGSTHWPIDKLPEKVPSLSEHPQERSSAIREPSGSARSGNALRASRTFSQAQGQLRERVAVSTIPRVP
jgi:hypothetical protein